MSSVYPSSILWTRIYLGSSDPVRGNAEVSEDERRELAVRRRLEDIKEAARLALYEVWEQ